MLEDKDWLQHRTTYAHHKQLAESKRGCDDNEVARENSLNPLTLRCQELKAFLHFFLFSLLCASVLMLKWGM